MSNFEDDGPILLKKLAELGGSSGNASLVKALGWTESRYWETRNELISQGVLTTGKGRGGSVKTIGIDPPASAESPVEESKGPELHSEVKTYPAIEKEFRDNWLRVQGWGNSRVNICAHQGKKQTGGRWSRPDLIVASVETYEYVPGKQLSVATYEVKLGKYVDVTSVYEAVSHLRSVHYAYLFVVGEIPSEIESDINAACLEHGVGLIVAEKASDYSTWEEWCPPVRNNPEPKDLNNTIYHFLKDKEWLKKEVR